jgi:hypothetical protein
VSPRIDKDENEKDNISVSLTLSVLSSGNNKKSNF